VMYSRGVPRSQPFEIRGDLQTEVMRIVWRLGEATVDDVRAAQPRRSRVAYTTIQTVLNRLHDRGLLTRERRGKAFVYRAAYAESEVVARSIGDRLAGASTDVRRAALVHLVEGLEPEELDEVARLANRIRRERRRR
jgi:predicted transcriptional regulator